MNKQQLAATLWASANDLRGKMDASEYKNYILGFLFYKFLSEHLENYLIKNEVTFADLDDDSIETIKEDLGYFIAESDLYRTWIANIAERKWKLSHVTDAINHFNENLYETQREDFEGVFADVILTSEKLGKDLSDKEIAIRKLIELLNKINITGNREYDVFGYIYEYLIAQFAMASGKKAGEFYTPHQVSRIMAAIVADELRPKEQSAVYDPTCGSGSLLLTVSDAVNHYEHKDNIQFFGQENNSTTYNIARMNLLMRGVKPANMILRNADTLKTDWPYGEVNGEDNPLFVDCVVANPPYSAKWNSERADKDTRFKDYGIAPATKADYAFLLHSLYHLKQDGIMAIVLPHGVLFRGNEEEKIRTKLLQRRQIDAIIGLPAGIFTNTGIPTIVMILRKQPKHNNVLFIDASQGFRKEKNSNVLRERDIKKILDTYRKREEIAGFSHLADLAEIEANQFNLNIPRYITPASKNESQNIDAHLNGGIPNEDIDQFTEFWHAFPALKNKLFSPLRTGFSRLNVPANDIFSTIEQDTDYQAFIAKMHANIEQWKAEASSAILGDEAIKSGQILPTFDELETKLFQRFAISEFTDPYEAYQLFVDAWNETIASDLEQLAENSGFDYARTLVPNMVAKGKDEEVQDGLKGAILPKDLIAERFFTAEKVQLEQFKQTASENEETINEHQSELTNGVENEEDLTALEAIIKTAKTNAKKATSALADWATQTGAEWEQSELQEKIDRLHTIQIANQAIKQAKDQLKKAEPIFDAQVEAKYAELSLTDIRQLLAQKWLVSLVTELENITHSHSKVVANQLKALDERYKETLAEIQTQRKEAEDAFWAMAKLLG
ncbi:type I restriction-modification system subunit M [Haemophilus parahaemolyticus]|uniref:type I restriction-modification system subunit M n=1 Tax=Haemophilus parahaemolyticus TaxID=735 RepID=UPI0029086162|nr:type I restriction-modification system subunit M [Haemophilus parahaemolyticus]MDU4464060.1 type I restriction-modification system subunit M [Haemophilus parahaemolyticus]